MIFTRWEINQSSPKSYSNTLIKSTVRGYKGVKKGQVSKVALNNCADLRKENLSGYYLYSKDFCQQLPNRHGGFYELVPLQHESDSL